MNRTKTTTGHAARSSWRAMRMAGLTTACLLTLSACRYTTFPLVPEPVRGEFPARLTAGSLVREGNDLMLNVRLDSSGKEGFVTVVWFRVDAELGRDQVYLDARDKTASFRFNAPEKGYYRAIVGFEGRILRQFELEEVPLIPPPSNPPPAQPSEKQTGGS